MRITCEGFEEEFLALLTTIEAGGEQSTPDLSINLEKKKERIQKANVGYE